MSDQDNNPFEAPFRYTPKASRSERDAGCEHLFWHYPEGEDDPVLLDGEFPEEEYEELKAAGERVAIGTIHPTVKPVAIMEWLMDRLTEPGDTVLDPFAGSGTTGIAAMRRGRDAHLVELNEDGTYEPIIRGRLRAAREEYAKSIPLWEERPAIHIPGDDEEEEVQTVSFFDLLG